MSSAPLKPPPRRRLIGRKEVSQLTSRSRSWIYAAMADGEFPQRVRTSAGRVGWHEHEVAAWIESRPRVERVEDVEPADREPVAAAAETRELVEAVVAAVQASKQAAPGGLRRGNSGPPGQPELVQQVLAALDQRQAATAPSGARWPARRGKR